MTFTELPSAYSLATYTSSGSGSGATWTVATHKQDHSTSAFYPASFVIKKTTCQNGNSQGFTVTWKDEFAIQGDITKQIGFNGATDCPYSIVSRAAITQVMVCGDSSGYLQDIHFVHSDGTTTKLGTSNCQANKSFTITVTGKIQGFHFRTYSETKGTTTTVDILANTFSVFVDSDPCSMVEATNPPVVAAMTITVNGPLVSQTLPSLSTYAFTYSKTSCTFSSKEYGGLAPSLTFFSLSSLTLSGSTTSPANQQVTTMSLYIDLKPYKRQAVTFVLTVICVIDAPVITPVTYTYEIGVNAQPINMAWTQTAASQFCSAVPSVVSLPSETFFTLTGVSTTGGNMTINGATLPKIGTYIVSLTNTLLIPSQVKFIDVTIILKDPCDRAIFEVSPNPFSNIAVTAPSVTPINTAFKVWTDVERSYSLVCAITASFTTTYTPVSVASPYTQTVVNPALVSLPTDIAQGPTLSHPVTILITNTLWPATTTAVSFSFNVVVTCTVTSLTLTSTQADYNYELKQGPYTTASYTAGQTSACNQPYTFTVYHYQNEVFVDMQNALFDSTSGKFTLSYTNAALIDTKQTYVLRATIPQIDPGTSAPMYVEKTLNIYIKANCENSTIVDKTINDMNILVTQSTTQDVSFQDSTAVTWSIPNKCGTKVYSFSPSLSFLTVASSIMTLSTSNPTDIGSWDVTMTVSLNSFPTITRVKVFKVTVVCQVMTLGFSTNPTNIFIEPGVTTQPQYSPFVSNHTPACANTVNYSFSTTPPGFTSLFNLAFSSGQIQANGAVLADKGVYSLMLVASVDGRTSNTSFTITIQDPCSRAIFQTTPGLSAMTLIRNFDTTKTQTFYFKTDIEVTYTLVCGLTATLLTPASYPYVSLSGLTISVDPSLTSAADVGLHTISIQATSTLYPGSVTAKTYTFVLNIQHCVVNTMSLAAITNVLYYLNQGALAVPFTAVTWSSLACQYTATYTASYAKGGSTITQPAWITFTPAGLTFSVNSSSASDLGVYDITLTASIPQPSDVSGVKKVSQTFQITIEKDCLSTSLIDLTITDMTIRVTEAAKTQSIEFLNTKAQLHGIPGFCGVRQFVWTPSKPPFLVIDASLATLTLATSSVSDVGVYNSSFTVSLVAYPVVTSIAKTIKITIICEVFTLTFSPVPSNIFVETGVTGPTAQPLTSAFTTTQTPACANPVAFTIVEATKPSFVNLQNLSVLAGEIKVDGALLADQNVYPLTLQAVVDSKTITTPFTVTISDPCKRAVFENSPSPVNMVLIRDFDPTQTQTFTLKTDVEVSYSLVCAYSTTLLTPAAYSYVSLTGLTISVNPALTSAADVGLHTISIQATSTLYSGTVTAKTYTFVLDIRHCVVNTMTLDPITNQVYTINDPLKTISFAAASWSDLACLYAVTYTALAAQSGSSISMPGFITFNATSRTFDVYATLPAAIGVYDITVTASIPQPSVTSGVKTVSQAFVLTVGNDCLSTILNDLTIVDMSVKVSQSTSQSVEFTNTKSVTFSNPDYCGLRKFDWSPSQPSYLSISADLKTLTLATNDPADVGIFTLQFTVSLASYPVVTSITKSLTITIICEVFTLTFSTAPADIFAETGVTGPTAQPLNSGYGVIQTPACANPVTFTVVEATKPSFVFLQNLSVLTGEIKVDGALLADQNVYPLTLQAAVDSKTITTPFTVTIQDPCKRAVFENSPSPVNMVLILDFDPTQTQTFTLKTDVEVSYSLVCAYSTTLLTPAAYSYVSLTGLTISVNPALTSAADVGLHTISIQATSTLYSGTVTAKTYTFVLDIRHCVVNTMTLDPIANQVYTINDPLKTIWFAAASWSDLACLYAVTYTALAAQSGSSISMPGFITFNATSRTFDVYATLPAAIGVYDITVTSSIPQPSVTSGVKTVSQAFVLTVGNDCLSTILNDLTIVDMSVKVSQSTSQSVEFTNTKSVTFSNPDYCGLRKFDWSPSQPSYLSISADLKTLTLATNNPADVGIFTFHFTVSLADYPSIGSFTKTIIVTIECEVLALAISTPPVDMFVETGITLQPFKIPFAVTQTPACGTPVVFVINDLLSAIAPVFVSIQDQLDFSGNVQVNGAVLADANVYQLTLEATVDSVTMNADFDVIIADPCARANFQTVNPFTNMVLIRDFDSVLMQPFTIQTDVESDYGLICQYTPGIFSGPTFVSLDGFQIKVDASLTSQADVGPHTVTMKIMCTLYPGSVPDATYTFVLDIRHCVVNTMTLDPITNQVYTINDPLKTISFTAASWSDLACLYAVTYTASAAQSGSSISMPGFITFNATSRTFDVFATLPAAIGVYDIIVTASIPQPSATSGVKTVSQAFVLTVGNDCLSTILNDMTIVDMSVKVSQSTSQSVEFTNTKSVTYANPDYCGLRKFDWSPSQPSYLSISADLKTLTLASTDPAVVGSFSYTFTVSLASYPSVTSITKTFGVTIICEVFTLTFSTAPADIFAETGVTGPTAQPLTSTFATTQTPACANPVAFTIVEVTKPSFVNLQNLSVLTGEIKVDGALLADQNVYPLTLQAAVDSKTITTPFTVTISDPCKRAVFENSPSPSNMVLIRDFDPTQTQTFTLKTNVEVAYSLVCAYTATLLTPLAYPYVSLTGSTISVDPSLTQTTDMGLHTISIEATSTLYPGSVTAKTYTFVLDIRHCVVNTMTLDPIANQIYTINDPLKTISFTAASWSDLACLYAVTYTASAAQSGSPIPMPGFITFNAISRTFDVFATHPVAIESYDISVTASIPQPSDTSGVKTVSQAFVLTVGNDCLSTILNDLTISDMTVKVSHTTSQSVEFTNTKSVTYANPDYCGLRKFDWSPSQPSYLSISADLKILTLATNNPADEGTFLFDLTVSLASYPVVSSIAKTIKITIICEVFTLTYSPVPSNIFAETGVTGTTAQPLTSAFTTTQTPACANPVTFTIVEATKPSFVNLQNLSVLTGEIKVDGALLADQNVYALTLQAAVDSQTITTPFTVTISDPCKRAVFENSPAPSSMVLIRDFDPTQTQTFTLKTDVEVAYSLVCAYTTTLLTPAAYSYVSLTGSTISVNPALTSAADMGLHTISIQATSTLYPGTVTAKTYTFVLDIQHCVVNTMTLATITDVTYTLNQGPLPIVFTAATWSDLACLYTVSYTASYAQSGSAISKPSFIAFDDTNRTFSISATLLTDLGVYDIIVTASIPQPSDASGVKTVSEQFVLTVVKDCPSTTWIARPFVDMQIRVTESTTQNFVFEDERAQFYSIPDFCGPRVVNFASSIPSFLQLDTGLTTLTLSTSQVLDAGTYDITFTISLQDYTGVAGVDTTFRVTIICEVFSISFVAPLSNMIFQPQVTPEPLLQVFTVTQVPACQNPVTYTFDAASPSFVSLAIPTSSGVQVQVQSATLADCQTYTIKLTVDVFAATIDSTFTLLVQDPCELAVFQPTTLPSFVLIRDFDQTLSNTFWVQTDMEVNFGVVCNIVGTLITPVSYVKVLGTTITLDESFVTSSDFGLQTITIEVNSLEYPHLVSPVQYTFNIDIQNCIALNFEFPAVSDTSVYIHAGVTKIIFDPAVWSNNLCRATETYSFQVELNGVVQAVTWLSLDAVNLTLEVDANNQSDVGVYIVTITAAIPTVGDGTISKTTTTSFSLEILNDCLLTSFVSRELTAMHTIVSSPLGAVTQDLFINDDRANIYGPDLYCGLRTYSLSPQPAFLSVTGDILSVQTSLVADTGVYLIDVTVGLIDWPDVPKITKQVSITIDCEVQSINVVKDPSLWNPYSYKIAVDAPLIIGFSFLESPKCGLTYSVAPLLSFVSLSSANNTVTVETDVLMNSGAFDLKVYATPALGVSSSVDINLNMIDICETTKIQSQKIASIRAFQQDPEYKPQQSISLNEFTYEAKALQVDCGPVLLSLHERNTTDSRLMQVSQWIQLEDLSIQVDLLKLTDAGSHKFELTAYLQNYPNVKTEMTFTVSQSGSQITCSNSMDQTYELGAPPISFGINYRNLTVNEDGVKLTPVRKPVALDEGGNPTNLPDFISFNPVTNLFKVEKGGVKDFGNYILALQIGYVEYPSFEVLCKTKLEMTYRPDFKGGAFTDQKFTCGDKWSMLVPKIEDVFGQPATLDVDFGDGSSIFQYASAVMKITTLNSDTKELSGTYTIAITMTDSMGSQKTQKIKVEIGCFSSLGLAGLPKTKFQPEYRKQVDPPKLYIEYMNNVGQLRVKFTKAIIIPTFERYPEFTNAKLMRQNCTAADAIKELCIKEDRRNLQKEIKDESKEAVDIINRGIVYVDDKYEKILDIKMKPGLASNEEKLYFSWKCVDFKSTYMDFAVNYTYFDEVSVHDLKDSIEVIVHGYYYFRSVYNNEYIEQETAIVEKPVPPQVNPDSAGALAATTATMAAASKSVVIANFVMNLFLGGAIQQLFSAIRKLTIMVHLLIVNVRIPANAQAFFAGLLSFVTFDIIELGPYIRAGLKLEETDDLTENFQNLGYQSNFFAINIGTQGMIICVLVLLLIFHVTTSGVKNEKFIRFRAIVTKGLIWNNLLTFFTESYMLMSISTVTNYTEFYFNSLGTIVSSNLCMLGTVIIFGFPLWLLIFLNAKKDKLHLKKYRDKYGEVYEHLAYRREGPKALLEPGLSLVRVLILTFTLIFLQEWRYFQIFIINACSTFMVVYTGLANPYTTKEKLFFEQFNECFIIIINYHLMCFADFVQDDWTRGIVGWSMMATVGFNLIINIGYIMFGAVMDSYKNIRFKYARWKLERLKKKLAARKAALEPIETSQVVLNNDYFVNDDQSVLRSGPDLRKAKLVPDGIDLPPQLIATKTKMKQVQKRKANRKFVPKGPMQMQMIPEVEESQHESQLNLVSHQDTFPQIKEFADVVNDAEDDLEKRLYDRLFNRNSVEKTNESEGSSEQPQGRLRQTSASFNHAGIDTMKLYWETKQIPNPDYAGIFEIQKYLHRDDEPYSPLPLGIRKQISNDNMSRRSDTKRQANYDEEEKSSPLPRTSLYPNDDLQRYLETKQQANPDYAAIFEIHRYTRSHRNDSHGRTADGPSEREITSPTPYSNGGFQMVDEPAGRERSQSVVLKQAPPVMQSSSVNQSVESLDRAVRVATRRREINSLMGGPQEAGVMFNQLWQSDRQSQK